MRKLSDNGIKFLGNEEGLRLKPYKDTGGNDTIGIGHLILMHEREELMKGITMERCMELFRQDVIKREKSLNDMLKVSISQGAFDALFSLMYNIGVGKKGSTRGLMGSKLLATINTLPLDSPVIRTYWLSHDNCKDAITGKFKKSSSLLHRREREYKMFMGG